MLQFEYEEDEDDEEKIGTPESGVGKAEVKAKEHPDKRPLVRGQSTERFISAVNNIRIGIRVLRSFQFHATSSVARAIDCDEGSETRPSKKASKKVDLGYFPKVLKLICKGVRKSEQCYLVVELLSPVEHMLQYLVVLRHKTAEGNKEDMIIGAQCEVIKGDVASVQFMVGIPIRCNNAVHLDGDGTFTIATRTDNFMVKPSNIQSQWAALNFLTESLNNAVDNSYSENGDTHKWCSHYNKIINQNNAEHSRQHWKLSRKLGRQRKSIVDIFENKNRVSQQNAENPAQEKLRRIASVDEIQKLVLTKLREVMFEMDLDRATCKAIREAVETAIGMELSHLKEFVDEKILVIYGQMDEPSKILDYLYLGTEWNACNLEELKENGITHVLNCTSEVDSFYEGLFEYHTIDVLDVAHANLLKHWEDSYKFIKSCKDSGGKVFVHCQMGVSRSGSTTISYIMREYNKELSETYATVKKRRNCVKPNPGFIKQLECYERSLKDTNLNELHDMLQTVDTDAL